MFKAILFLAFVGTALAYEYRVTEYYLNSACTQLNLGKYQTFSTVGGCFKAGAQSHRYTRVTGGYNVTLFSSTDCTGSPNSPPGTFFEGDKDCFYNGIFYLKTAWKSSVPLTAAELAKGHIAKLNYENAAVADCSTTIVGGTYYKLGACGKRDKYYSISDTDPTQIVSVFNCTHPETPQNQFKTTCFDDAAFDTKGVIGTKKDGELNGGKLVSSFRYVLLASTLALMLLFL
jgi:hypothetical protein